MKKIKIHDSLKISYEPKYNILTDILSNIYRHRLINLWHIHIQYYDSTIIFRFYFVICIEKNIWVPGLMRLIPSFCLNGRWLYLYRCDNQWWLVDFLVEASVGQTYTYLQTAGRHWPHKISSVSRSLSIIT